MPNKARLLSIIALFPYAKVLCDAVLSAEVFACAAFGENVLSFFHLFFHLGDRIVMVTEYHIEADDTNAWQWMNNLPTVLPKRFYKY